jgi:hypothetical protein
MGWPEIKIRDDNGVGGIRERKPGMFAHKLWLPIALLLFFALACSTQTVIPAVVRAGATATATATLTPTFTPTQTPTPASPANQPTPAAPSQAAASPTSPFPDLNGVWVDGGNDIVIVQNGQSVSASYAVTKMCNDQVGNISPYPYDFSATLQQVGGAWQANGKTIVCGYGKDNPTGVGPQATDIRMVLSQDQSSLVGDWYNAHESQWMVGGVSITRKFVNGAPAPTPAGYTPPTLAP